MPESSTVYVRVGLDASDVLERLEQIARVERAKKRKRFIVTAGERPEILPYIVAVIAVIGIIVLTALGDKIPDILNVIAGGAVIGGAAISQGHTPPPA